MSLKKDFFLINNGTSCKDIYEKMFEYYKIKRKEGIEFDESNKQILKNMKKDRSNKLSLNGIIECREMKKDEKMSSIKNNYHHFYCLCDRLSIETALVFLNNENSPYLTLNVLPFIKNEKEIIKANDLTIFKDSFGQKSNNNMKNYWNIKSNIINNRKSLKINWTLVDNKSFIEIKSYNINNLKNDLDKLIKNYSAIDKVVLFCNSLIIKDYIRNIKNNKYKPDPKMKLYNTHCINLKYDHDVPKHKLELTKYDTYYPQKLGSNNIKYEFEGNKYEISYKYLLKKRKINNLNIIPYTRCMNNEKINNLILKMNNKKKNKKISINTMNNIENFNNVYKKLESNKN